MGRLIKAIINFFRWIFGLAASKLEDPVRDGKFAIEDSKEQIADFRMKIAKLIAENKRMERKLEASKQNITKWTSIAESAASKGDREGTAKALGFKSRATSEVNTLNNEIVKTENIIASLKNQLETAQNKIGSAESNITRLSARKEAAEIRKGLANAATGLTSSGNPLASLDKLEQEVDADESEAEALEEMASSENADADLEAKYGGGGSDVDAELEALMDKHNKPK